MVPEKTSLNFLIELSPNSPVGFPGNQDRAKDHRGEEQDYHKSVHTLYIGGSLP